MTKPYAIIGARVFDGERMRDGMAVVVEDGRIRALCSADSVAPDVERREAKGLLAPGFIDCQVNGGGGVLFNDAPSIEGIRAIGAAHRRFGTTGFLPTLITDTREKMAAGMAAVRRGIAEGVPGLLGIHLEGPFLNSARKGVHDAQFMRPIEDEDIALMTSLGAGRTVVTLAPEMVPMAAIARLARAGAVVSAGHTEAGVEVLEEARAHGLAGYTHLFNAMPPLMSREPGPVGHALSSPDLWASIIADLHHVAPASLRAAIAAKADRLVLVTDAMPTVGTDIREFDLQGRRVTLKEGRLTTAEGTLAGSTLDMATAVRNLVGLGVDPARALRMASTAPAALLRLDSERGKIALGYSADLVLLDEDYAVKATWIDGTEA